MTRTPAACQAILEAYRTELARAVAEGDLGAPVRDRVADRLGVPTRTLRYRVRAWGLSAAVTDLESAMGWRSWAPCRKA
jgi:hypothetical protein